MAIEADIQVALMGRVATLSVTPALTVVYREKRGELPNGPYVLVDSLWNESARKALDDVGQDYMGILTLGVARPIGEYEAAYRETAGQVAAHFVGQVLTSGLATVVIDRVTVGSGSADGEHWRIPVRVNWRA